MSHWSKYVEALPATQPDLPVVHELTVDRRLSLLRLALTKVMDARRQFAPLARQCLAVEPILDDPASATDPRYPVWQAQYAELLERTVQAMKYVLVEAHLAQQQWDALDPDTLEDEGLYAFTGATRETKWIDHWLATTREGPIQTGAPIPAGWEFPEDQVRDLPAAAKMALGRVPF